MRWAVIKRRAAKNCMRIIIRVCWRLLADPAKLIPSDYIRLSLSLTAIGIDPRNIEGNDLLEKIDQADREMYFKMSTSSLAYALA